MLSTLNCETKQGDTNAGPHLSYLVQPNLHGERQRLPSLKVLWIRSFLVSTLTPCLTALRCTRITMMNAIPNMKRYSSTILAKKEVVVAYRVN